MGKQSARMKSGTELAFVGDAVFELMVRAHLAVTTDANAGQLHELAVEYVCAAAQSRALGQIEKLLTDQEKNIARRGQNASKIAAPRSAGRPDYRRSTALEALFGYLYLEGKSERIKELFEAILETHETNRSPKQKHPRE